MYLSFIDDNTPYNELNLLARKDEAGKCFENYKNIVER